jgi:hypothetical protein
MRSKVAAAITGFLRLLLLTLLSHAGHTMHSTFSFKHAAAVDTGSSTARKGPYRTGLSTPAVTTCCCCLRLQANFALHHAPLPPRHTTPAAASWPPVLLQHCRTRRAQLPLQLLQLRAYCPGAGILLLLPGWRLLGPAPFPPLCLLMQSRWSWTWSGPQQPSQSGP